MKHKPLKKEDRIICPEYLDADCIDTDKVMSAVAGLKQKIKDDVWRDDRIEKERVYYLIDEWLGGAKGGVEESDREVPTFMPSRKTAKGGGTR